MIIYEKDGSTLMDSASLAERLKKEHGVVVTNRGPFVRVSAHFYNGSEDLERFVAGLEALMA